MRQRASCTFRKFKNICVGGDSGTRLVRFVFPSENIGVVAHGVGCDNDTNNVAAV